MEDYVLNRTKRSSSDAAWALITDGVVSSRIEAHRLKHLVSRGIKLIESSEQKEHLYQVAGDLINSVPKRIEVLEGMLNRTSYALSLMGKDFLRSRLPLSDRALVEESLESSSWFGSKDKNSSSTPLELKKGGALKSKLIRLAYENPELRRDLLPLIYLDYHDT